jgi:hypothetical protein
MSRRSLPLVLALLAGALAGLGVAQQRIGLALFATLALVIAAAWSGTRRAPSRTLLVLAGALALQPVLRDAGWVVAVDVAACVLCAGAAVAAPRTWAAAARAAVAPWRLIGGGTWVARAASTALPRIASGVGSAAILRGVAISGVLLTAFGALFVTADSAFAQLAGDAVAVDADPAALAWRAVLALLVAAGAGALVRAGAPPALGPPARAPWAPGRTESRIALSALVALFALFVAVQLRVLFGGADYVRATTGLGFGAYARQGFVELLLVGGLTLAVVAVAARRDDRRVRGLLAALCALTLVVLVSALHRLDLVVDAYGLTRVRYAGAAVVVALAALFVLVLLAGVSASVRRLAPRIVVVGTAAGVLAFSLSDPDARIAARAVDRQAATGRIDVAYLGGLSADAVPALRRLPEPVRSTALAAPLRRLERADGLAGFNLARRAAR